MRSMLDCTLCGLVSLKCKQLCIRRNCRCVRLKLVLECLSYRQTLLVLCVCLVLYFCTTLLMIATVIAIVLLFIYYTRDPACVPNKLFISINSVLCLLICVFSVLPCITRSQWTQFLAVFATSTCHFLCFNQGCV